MNLSTTLDLQAQYKLDGRTTFQGLPISVENQKGSVRKGKCEKGKPWSCWRTRMTAHYGYLTNGMKGVDGDKLDVFIGPDENAKVAYVVHTKKAPTYKEFDEDKCMLGFGSAAEAKKAFIANYGGEEKHFGSMDAIPMNEFKKRVSNPKVKPQKLVAAWELIAGHVEDTLEQEENGAGASAHAARVKAGGPGSGRHKELYDKKAEQARETARFDKRQTSLYGPEHEKELQKLKKKKGLKAEVGEPSTYSGGYGHIDPVPSFHPPSLKKAKRVPTDDPQERDNSFLDVTNRKDRATKRMRDRLTKQHNTLGGIPPNTAVNHHTGMFLPFVTNG